MQGTTRMSLMCSQIKLLLEKYGFPVTEEALALANPIAEELNTLRSTDIGEFTECCKA